MSKNIRGFTSANLTINELSLLSAGFTTLEAVNATITGTLTVNNISISGSFTVTNITVTGNINANTMTITGLLTASGGISGNLTGNVTSTGANTMGSLTVSGTITGDLTGDVTGDLTGDVTGDVTGNLTGNVTSTGANSMASLTVSGTLDGATVEADTLKIINQSPTLALGSLPTKLMCYNASTDEIIHFNILSFDGNSSSPLLTVSGDISCTDLSCTDITASGTITGDVTGDLTGDVTGNITSVGSNSMNSLTVTNTLTLNNATGLPITTKSDSTQYPVLFYEDSSKLICKDTTASFNYQPDQNRLYAPNINATTIQSSAITCVTGTQAFNEVTVANDLTVSGTITGDITITPDTTPTQAESPILCYDVTNSDICMESTTANLNYNFSNDRLTAYNMYVTNVLNAMNGTLFIDPASDTTDTVTRNVPFVSSNGSVREHPNFTFTPSTSKLFVDNIQADKLTLTDIDQVQNGDTDVRSIVTVLSTEGNLRRTSTNDFTFQQSTGIVKVPKLRISSINTFSAADPNVTYRIGLVAGNGDIGKLQQANYLEYNTSNDALTVVRLRIRFFQSNIGETQCPMLFRTQGSDSTDQSGLVANADYENDQPVFYYNPTSNTLNVHNIDLKNLPLNYTQTAYNSTWGIAFSANFGGGNLLNYNNNSNLSQKQYGKNITGGAWDMAGTTFAIRSNDYAGLWRVSISVNIYNNLGGTNNRINPRILLYKGSTVERTVSDGTAYVRNNLARYTTVHIEGVIRPSATTDAYSIGTFCNIESTNDWSSTLTSSQYVAYHINIEFRFLGILPEYSV